MNSRIADILVHRDGISSYEADSIVREAKFQLAAYLQAGRLNDAEDICNEFFGLEPDYILDLM